MKYTLGQTQLSYGLLNIGDWFRAVQAIIRQSSGNHQTIIRPSSGHHQAIIRQSSGNHQAKIFTKI
jgi:hypothetical protein